MCTRSATGNPRGTPFMHKIPPPPSWPETDLGTHRNPPSCIGKPFLDPFLDPFLHRNPPSLSRTRTPFLYPFLDTFYTGPPPSCT